MSRIKTDKKYKLDAGHYFKCERSTNGRYKYEVWRGDAQLARKLFNTECTASSTSEVESHAREELRLFIARES